MKWHIALCFHIYSISPLVTDINESIKIMCIKSVNVTNLGKMYNTFNDKRHGSKSS